MAAATSCLAVTEVDHTGSSIAKVAAIETPSRWLSLLVDPAQISPLRSARKWMHHITRVRPAPSLGAIRNPPVNEKRGKMVGATGIEPVTPAV
jgi:hypothetical protein